MVCFSWKNLNCPHCLLFFIYTRLSEAEGPVQASLLSITESALSGSWLFHFLWYYLSKYSIRKDNQESIFFKNVFINLLTNNSAETKWTIFQLNLDSTHVSILSCLLFRKHNFQNVLYCINKLVLHNNPDDIITTGSIIPHLKDKEDRAQKGYVSYPRSKSIVES